MRKSILAILLSVGVLYCVRATFAAEPNLILHHGRIVTADPRFSMHQAIAVTTDRIRININGSADGWSRITEVEAWGR